MTKHVTVSSAKLAKAVTRNTTMSGMLRDLGMRVNGGNFATMKKRIAELGITTKHWLGFGHLKGRPSRNKGHGKPLSGVMVRNSAYARCNLKRRLIEECVLELKCALCGLESEWQDKPLVLVLDHINGVNNDHRLKNLRLLCPNCNSQTTTFCGRNIKSKIAETETACIDCGTGVYKTSRRCHSCANSRKRRAKIEWPMPKKLKAMIAKTNTNQVAARLGVSWNAVNNRVKNNDL